MIDIPIESEDVAVAVVWDSYDFMSNCRSTDHQLSPIFRQLMIDSCQ